ncbi:FecR domain-containing protein [Bradyrhizobium sp. CER78]|uniref:FecR family protein n=1 Tax=Bradyrhizobium sp. CER78 TaxID=3039162 RepID=UPI00244A3CF5|nr:FecR domain-containing protein [Bradyrhizobium sp. CER78]MDH2383624.1 FecR domain-containing protein [Bradyrhizobium sp. CER78]
MIDSDRHHDELSVLEREAHAWIRRLTSGEARAADAAALQRWCGQSPAHAAAFSEASQFWKAFGPAGQSLLEDERATSRRSRVGGRSPIMSRRVVVGGALAAAATGIMVVRPPLDLWPSLFELRADYRTGVGEQREVAVVDGVAVQMNTRTSIALGSGAASGTVELIAGEASFKVADRGAETFSVIAASGKTTSAGAQFDVRVDGASVCVTCLTNEARVEYRTQQVVLKSRQRVTYSDSGFDDVVAIDPSIAAAWQQGLIICNMMPLTDLIQELNRYRSGRIVLLNAEFGRNPVNGRFRIDRPDEALVQIERAFGIRARTLPGGLVLLS